MHLKMGRFTQHFIDVLQLSMTPLDFFEKEYPEDSRQDLRKYLGRFGVSGKMQVQKMEELSDGQKSRVVFAKLGRDNPHILLLDEPTNHLDMESIDALALAIQQFDGGLVLVSHDMRLISQVAQEIWICDNKTITPYKGDIQNFKMDMRSQMGIDNVQLKGDASVMKSDDTKTKKATDTPKIKPQQIPEKKKELPKQSPPPKPAPSRRFQDLSARKVEDVWGSDDEDDTTRTTQSSYSSSGLESWQSNKSKAPAPDPAPTYAPPKGRYVPPHLRNRS